MKFRLSFLYLFLASFCFSQANDLSVQKVENIQHIISLFKTNNIDEIARQIQYPLHRTYPVPDIKNEKELQEKFDFVFSSAFIKKIANSTLEDWSEMGWRGIMLEDGKMWINSEDGKIIAVNEKSILEVELRKKLIAAQKQRIHPSLKNFETPVYLITTKNYLIRIDEISNGNYRYASWKIGKSESTTPDLIIKNGTLQFSGSGGNHTISFHNKNYSYIIYRNEIGTSESAPFDLTIEKDGKIILSESGIFFD